MTAAHRILLIGLSSEIAPDVIGPLRAAGYAPHLGTNADLRAQPWTAVISAPTAPGVGSLELLSALADVAGNAPPLLLIGKVREIAGLQSGRKIRILPHPFEPDRLVATIRSVVRDSQEQQRPSDSELPALHDNVQSGEAFSRHIAEQIASGAIKGQRTKTFVASLRLHERGLYSSSLPISTLASIFRKMVELATQDAPGTDLFGQGPRGTLLIMLREVSSRQARDRLQRISDLVSQHAFRLPGQEAQFTPIIGYTHLRSGDSGASAESVLADVQSATEYAASRLDLQPYRYRRVDKVNPQGHLMRWLIRLVGLFPAKQQIWVQFALTLFLGLVVPFAIYYTLGSLGIDITGVVYIAVVAMLFLTAVSIWVEGWLALLRQDPPAEPGRPYPPATAIIAAYLPNEAPVIESTIEAFLRMQYPASLQIILAYNTPKDLEVEARLRAIAAAHPNFIPMKVEGSTSKAQNVNAALAHATGTFTAVFDADHQPDPDSFRRAWRWLSNGADVVQGHCLIRNGADSWVAKMIAIEFEQIYAVSHPGRARLHGFGIFGGSNGYWHTDLLRRLRMHGFMLTEDIDSSMRAVISGRKIVSDPYIVSRELAPETMNALLKQRLRWAQGWFQISKKWIMPAMRSPHLNVQQKLGMMQLLVWREVFPWVSMQIVPLVTYWAIRAGGVWNLDWFVPILVFTTLFTLSTGPGQIAYTYHLADPQIKREWRWFGFCLWTSTLFYSGLKNAWNRIAHLKEAMGETTWVVTPRVIVKKGGAR